MTRSRVNLGLTTVVLLAVVFGVAYVAGGDPPPPTAEELFARMAGFSVPPALGDDQLIGVDDNHARYERGASIIVHTGGPSRYIQSWDPDKVVENLGWGPYTYSVVDVRGARALATESRFEGRSGVTLAWVSGNARIEVTAPNLELDEAIEAVEGME